MSDKLTMKTNTLTMSFPRKRESSNRRSPTLSEKNVQFFSKSAPRISASVKTFGDDRSFSIWISRYTKLLAGATFLLIVAGGLVTSTKSGLSVPDWPLSYGQWMPPMVGGVRYEHTHRMIASLVGLMTLILAVWIGFSESRKWLRWTTIAAFGAVVLQGILGGMTVLFLLPAPISIFHACLAQTFFALTVCLAYFTSREWNTAEGLKQDVFNVKRPLFILILLTYLQLILGATVRHTANHYVLVSHIISGFLVLIHAVIVMKAVIASEAKQSTSSEIASTFSKFQSRNDMLAVSLAFITLLQTALGMGSFIYSVALRQTLQPQPAKIFFVTAHQSLGALLLATAVFLFVRILRVER